MKKNYLYVGLAAAALMLAGCKVDGKVSGGGFITSLDGVSKASYGFNASDCDGKAKANFHFNDKGLGVAFKSTELYATGLCDSTNGTEDNYACALYCLDGEHTVEFYYESTNKDYPGTGIAGACLTDGGEGVNEGDGLFGDDTIDVYVESGPFAGYRNIQYAVGGNIQEHACPGSKNK